MRMREGGREGGREREGLRQEWREGRREEGKGGRYSNGTDLILGQLCNSVFDSCHPLIQLAPPVLVTVESDGYSLITAYHMKLLRTADNYMYAQL